MISLGPLGDRAFLASFEAEDDARIWLDSVRVVFASHPGIVDLVLAYRTAAVFADPGRIDLESLEKTLREIEPATPDRGLTGSLIELPVLYDGDDLVAVASLLGIPPDEVISRHCDSIYRVFAIGFQPGFPYAGYLPASLSGLPRRSSPRTRVEAGSVAIAGRQTGVYPRDSPGGWHLIGRTPLVIANLETGHFPIQAGDRLRFKAIHRDEFETMKGERLESHHGHR